MIKLDTINIFIGEKKTGWDAKGRANTQKANGRYALLELTRIGKYIWMVATWNVDTHETRRLSHFRGNEEGMKETAIWASKHVEKREVK